MYFQDDLLPLSAFIAVCEPFDALLPFSRDYSIRCHQLKLSLPIENQQYLSLLIRKHVFSPSEVITLLVSL